MRLVVTKEEATRVLTMVITIVPSASASASGLSNKAGCALLREHREMEGVNSQARFPAPDHEEDR